MATSVMEELEIKEPTPSLAPSQYESPLYTKKWRIVLAVLLGATLMGLCILGFYVNVKARGEVESNVDPTAQVNTTASLPPRTADTRWRSSPYHPACLSVTNDTCPEDYAVPPLLVVGVDGLRPDFLSDEVTPALSYLTRCGASARSLVPTYPTTTFPNMYTIATGLYPESHGVVGNSMFDPLTNQSFSITDDSILSPAWWGGEPIWNTVTKQRKKSATYFWPGSDVLIEERYPVYWEAYQNETFERRVQKVLDWLTLPESERPALIMVYFEEPLLAMQESGPFSQEAKVGLEMIDSLLDDLMSSLYEHHLAHCVNLMVVSDHGVAPASCSSNFYLQTFISDIKQRAQVQTGAVGRLRAVNNSNIPEAEQEILNTLRCKTSRIRALPKALLPRRYHYANNQRIENVLLDTDLNTQVIIESQRICKKAGHGFNNLEPSMQATFIGFGPDFKVNITSHSFRNVELYNLMCQLLHISPASNNGTTGSLNHLLRYPPPGSPSPSLSLLPEEVLPPPDSIRERNTGDNKDKAKKEKCQCFLLESPKKPLQAEVVVVSNSSENNSNTTTNTSTTTNTTSTTAQPPTPSTTPPGRTDAELSLLLNTHVPWGSPGLSTPDNITNKLKVLLHSSHVIGLHETLNLGVWTSFTLTNLTITQITAEEDLSVLEEEPTPCWRADPRLERLQQDQCQRMLTTDAFLAANITLIQLYPKEVETKELLQKEGYLLSNLAAVKAGYLAGARAAMIGALRGWATTFEAINVVHGPIFDYNLDGHQDAVSHTLNTVKPLVPSDYFFVISQCGKVPCPEEPQQVMAFIFPNSQFADNCLMNDTEYLNYHLTTVRDVELLTGLHFFKNVYNQAAVQHRTHQPLHIWPLHPPSASPVLSKLSERTGKADIPPVVDIQTL